MTHSTGLLSRLDAADALALSWVARRRAPALVKLMRGITRTGDALVVAAALGLALVLRPGRIAALVTVATVTGLALFWVTKRIIRRSRPTVHVLIAAPDRFSLPSGHATCAWALAIAWSSLAPAAALPICAWALLVSASRIVLAVHYPFDVLAGALLGALAAASTILIFG